MIILKSDVIMMHAVYGALQTSTSVMRAKGHQCAVLVECAATQRDHTYACVTKDMDNMGRIHNAGVTKYFAKKVFSFTIIQPLKEQRCFNC